MSVYAPALSHIWNGAEEFGLNAKELFEETGIDPNLRFDITARVNVRHVDNLLWIANQKSQDDAFAFKLAKHLQPSYLGALGLAWLTSSSLRKAFERLERYVRMVSEELKIRIEDQVEELRVKFDAGSFIYRDLALRERVSQVMVVQLCRMTYGDSFSPTAIHFQHSAPSKVSVYYEFFRCELIFDSESNVLVIPALVADQPLTGFNPQLVQLLDSMIIDYLASLDKDDIIGRTKSEILKQLPSGGISLEGVSTALNFSQRSLERRLKEKNESFKNLLATLRRELSKEYIQDMRLSITEISFLLGFSQSSSFSRAYKSWTGKSPSTHREEMQSSSHYDFQT